MDYLQGLYLLGESGDRNHRLTEDNIKNCSIGLEEKAKDQIAATARSTCPREDRGNKREVDITKAETQTSEKGLLSWCWRF